MWALAGGKSIQPVPIRDGETTAEIRLDLGDLIVVRRFTASGSTVKVSTKDGANYSSPQQILDAMVAKLAFDPLAFTKLKPEEQGRALAELVAKGGGERSGRTREATPGRSPHDPNRGQS